VRAFRISDFGFRIFGKGNRCGLDGQLYLPLRFPKALPDGRGSVLARAVDHLFLAWVIAFVVVIAWMFWRSL
jgi:hypothetical protein